MDNFVGRTLGDYRIESLLGEGSTGNVFRAVQLSSQTAVAVKVLHSSLTTDPNFSSRFAREAEVVTALTHPNICKVHHFGEHDRNFYIVMESVSGGSVGSLFSHRATIDRSYWMWTLVDLVRQAADGLAAAHEFSVVHGYVGPNNLLLNRGGSESYRVKVVDFGIASLVGIPESVSGDDDSSVYQAPEQLQGTQAGARSDLYSLGVILYEVTTGRLPFAGKGGRGGYQYLPVVPPSQVLPQFPEQLEPVILRCLAKTPGERFSSVAEFSAALQVAASHARDEASLMTSLPQRSPSASLPVRQPKASTQVVGSAGQAPPRPPMVGASKKGASALPAVQVLSQSGSVLDIKYLSGSGMTIGRTADNQIQLDSDQVSRNHARLNWDGNRVTVTDLGAANSTFLQGHRLLPQVAQEWGKEQWLRIGPFWLWLDHSSVDVHPESLVEVLIDQSHKLLTLTPGKKAVCRIVLVNQKTQVDHVSIKVDGVPSEWVQGTEKEVRLQPYEKKDVVLTIDVPKQPSSFADEYDVKICASSQAEPDAEQGMASACWTVEPFHAMSFGVTPPRAQGRRKAKFSINFHNEGNLPANYSLSGTDEEKKLEFQFSTERQNDQSRVKVELDPGSKAAVKLKVNAPRRWVGNAQGCNFNLQATPTGEGDIELAEAQFIHLAIFPNWMLALAPLVLLGFFLLIPQIAKPRVSNIYVDPREPVAGEPVDVFWEEHAASRIRVLVNEMPIKPDPEPSSNKYRIPRGFDKDVRLKIVGTNIFGEAAKEITVAVKPPPAAAAPVIDLVVSAPSITKGGTVTLSWSITGAQRAELNLLGTVPLRGSHIDKPVADQTYTITAFNANNVEAKKSITVKVEPEGVPRPQFSVSATRITQGQSVIFTWNVKNAQGLRIDSISPATLTGGSGSRQARLKGEGNYSFVLVATDAKGEEVRSDPLAVTVKCSTFQLATKRCKKAPEVEWR